MEKPDIGRVHEVMRAKGYKVFDNPKGFDINIVGIRAEARTPDVFDDLLTVSYIERGSGRWASYAWACTTDSGEAIMRKPLDGTEGAAFLQPGQFRGSHKIRLHQGKYEALCQKWGTKLPVYRMNRLEDQIDWKPSFTLFGNGTGINIHRGRATGITTKVGRWSAGCQVFQDVFDFAMFMNICREARKAWGNSFSYTLLDEADLNMDLSVTPTPAEEPSTTLHTI